MLKLSFILPCYNVAPYIGRCIESIEHQDIPKEEYEVICVDDCSKDNTADVIREYQKQYPNIRLICHEVNKNAGGARNSALEVAKGEYVWCVDPDDSILPNVIERLMRKAKRFDLDILLFNMMFREEKGREYTVDRYKELDYFVTGEEFVVTKCADNKYLYNVAGHTCCLYKKEFLDKNHICYPEIRSSQDVVFIWNAILTAQKVSSTDAICYKVFRRPDSTTGSKGKLRANALISASLLYINEVGKLRGICNNKIIDDNLLYEMRLSLNDDSRKLLHATLREQYLFYNEVCKYAAMVDQYKHLMNRKTKVIFNHHLPYGIWQMIMWSYMVVGKCKL